MNRRHRFISEEGVDFVFVSDLNELRENIASILTSGISSELNEIKKLQQLEFKSNETYREGWKIATKRYIKKKKEIEEHYRKKHSDKCEYPDEYHIALICYTISHPLFKEFNKATREFRGHADLVTYKFRSFFILLYNSIVDMPGHPYQAADVLYRCVNLLVKAPKDGKIVAFQHFVSTSRSESKALEFFTKEGSAKTCFVIKGYTANCSSLDLHSAFPREKECLIWPAEYYVVEYTEERIMDGKRVRYIHLKM